MSQIFTGCSVEIDWNVANISSPLINENNCSAVVDIESNYLKL